MHIGFACLHQGKNAEMCKTRNYVFLDMFIMKSFIKTDVFIKKL